jgi:hypothetical protein
MATSIKDGNGGTDQAGVLPVAKSLKVTLVDALGNLNATPIATSTTGALEAGGNLAELRAQADQVDSEVFRQLLIEMRINNELLFLGLNIQEDYTKWREDRAFAQIDTPNL